MKPEFFVFCAKQYKCFLHTFASSSDAWDSSIFASDSSIRNWSRMTDSGLLGVLHFCKKFLWMKLIHNQTTPPKKIPFSVKLPDTAQWLVGYGRFHWIWPLYKRYMTHASTPKASGHPSHPKLDDKTCTSCIDSHRSYLIYRCHSVNKWKKMRLIINWTW